MENQPKLCFIISCKVVENYQSYLPFYISNIKKYYPTALIILVDNNSSYQEIYINLLNVYPDLILLENTSIGKFELGAYKFATDYIIKEKLNFDYYICMQDTFILVNKYDFNILKEKNIKACSIHHISFERCGHYAIRVLKELNLYDPDEKFFGTWCNSWICDYESLLKIREICKDIHPLIKYESQETERYIGKILKLLNNNICYAIEKEDELERTNRYCVWSIDPTSEYAKNLGYYFIKKTQAKDETVK